MRNTNSRSRVYIYFNVNGDVSCCCIGVIPIYQRFYSCAVYQNNDRSTKSKKSCSWRRSDSNCSIKVSAWRSPKKTKKIKRLLKMLYLHQIFTEDEANKALLEAVVPALNRWQVFPLQQRLMALYGTIKICLMSEAGKININLCFDFKKTHFHWYTSPKRYSKIFIK